VFCVFVKVKLPVFYCKVKLTIPLLYVFVCILLEKAFPKMTSIVSGGTLNPSHSLTHLGGDSNLMLKSNEEATARAQEGTIFFCVWAKCRPLFSCCVHRNDAAGSRGKGRRAHAGG